MNLTVKPRLNYIDSTRGIAILFVVIGHMCSLNYGLGQYFYSFHMPIFFIISGILLFYNNSWKNIDSKSIFIKKLKSLLYPYIVFSLLALVYIYFFKDYSSLIKGIIASISLDGIGALWFLPSLLIGELVFIYLEKYLGKCHIIAMICIFLLTTLTSTICTNFGYFTLTQINKYLGLSIINRSLIAYLFIAIGYYFGFLKDKLSKSKSNKESNLNKNKNYFLILGVIICFIINLSLFNYNVANLHYSIIGNPILYYVNALSGSFAYIGLGKLILYKSKALIFYGKASLIIFVTHGPLGVIYLIKNNFMWLPVNFMGLPFNTRWLTMVILLIIAETIIAYVISKYLKFLTNYNEFKKIFSK